MHEHEVVPLFLEVTFIGVNRSTTCVIVHVLNGGEDRERESLGHTHIICVT